MKYWGLLFFSLLFLPATAQRIQVEEFAPYPKPFWKKATFTTDKQQALLDLFTQEKGFQFQIGDRILPATEGEGVLTLALSPHTDFITIKHPDYGQLTWKIPGKALKKKRRYRAYLSTDSPQKAYQSDKQWLLLTVQPEHAIVYIDSLMHPLQNGQLALYLPLGQHACRIESPFYQPWADTLTLTDSVRLEHYCSLTPYYGYLTVETTLPDAQILLEGQPLGTMRVETGRLTPGRYRLTIRRGETPYYDQFIEIENAERQVVDLRQHSWQPLPTSSVPGEGSISQKPLFLNGTPAATAASRPDGSATERSSQPLSSVYLTAGDADTEIWLNREKVGTGTWQGTLPPGFYAVSTRKDSLESKTQYLWVEAGKPVEWTLPTPQSAYGWLNISCNEIGATVFLNGQAVGSTPCLLRDLPIDRSYRIRLEKGRKHAETVVHLKGNDQVDVNLLLKKR